VGTVVTPATQPATVNLEGYEPLPLRDLYVLPAGPHGLQFTEKTRALNHRRVRIEGHMVRHFHEDAGLFLFADVPAAHNQAEYMLADSLPTSLMHVQLPVIEGRTPAWRRERLIILGTLEIGARQEIDGRVSHVRLIADHIAEARSLTPVELRRPIALQRDRMTSGVRTVFRSQTSPTHLNDPRTPPPNTP
jgi:hypothetical protein